MSRQRWPLSSSCADGAKPPPDLVKQALRPPKWWKPPSGLKKPPE